MSLEQIIAVETRGAGFVPLHGGMIEKRIVQQLLPKICRSFFRLNRELQGTYFLFSWNELINFLSKLGIWSEIYRYLLYTIGHQSAR